MSNRKEVIIDLEFVKRKTLNEGLLGFFGDLLKYTLFQIFGSDTAIPVKVIGKESDVKSFAKAFSSEEAYIRAVKKYGLHKKETYNKKETLDKAVSEFEKGTGIKWPFK
jgi:hypothetical protein